MLIRFVSKFWVEPRSPFSNISHHDPKTIWKTPNIVSWPECRPEFPSDGGDGGGGDVPTTLPSGQSLDHHAQGPNIPFGVNPSLRQIYMLLHLLTLYFWWRVQTSLLETVRRLKWCFKSVPTYMMCCWAEHCIKYLWEMICLARAIHKLHSSKYLDCAVHM